MIRQDVAQQLMQQSQAARATGDQALCQAAATALETYLGLIEEYGAEWVHTHMSAGDFDISGYITADINYGEGWV